MDKQSSIERQLQGLRRGFDQTFVEPVAALETNHESLLGIRVAGRRLALRLSELDGFQRMGKIMPLPTHASHLLGVSGIRGRAVPIFDLASVLWNQSDVEELRWVALFGRDQPVGFGFAGFDGYLRVDGQNIHRLDDQERNDRLPEVVRIEGAVRGILSIKAILAELAQHSDTAVRKGQNDG